MSFTTIATANQKGQVVIPKKIRDELGIDSQVKLLISQRNSGVFIQPVKGVITQLSDCDSGYTELLAKTQGAWQDDQTWPEQSKARSQLEKQASQKRRSRW